MTEHTDHLQLQKEVGTVTSESKLWGAWGADCLVHQEARVSKVYGDIVVIHTAHLCVGQ